MTIYVCPMTIYVCHEHDSGQAHVQCVGNVVRGMRVENALRVWRMCSVAFV